MKHLICVLQFLVLTAAQTAQYSKFEVSHPDALCLDGSAPAVYISEGSQPDQIILLFEGGGWCGKGSQEQTLQSCYMRSKTSLGSSKNYPSSIQIGEGIMSNNPLSEFRHMTKVLMKYCDGSVYQGSASAPIQHKGRKLYFRGANNTVAQLQEIQKQVGIFSKAKQIMVTGTSAGALAVYLWADYIRERANTDRVFAVADAGIFLNFANPDTLIGVYREQFMNLFKLSNVETPPPARKCAQARPNHEYMCMFAEQLFGLMQTPVFAVESLYDTWSIGNILGISCINNYSLLHCTSVQRRHLEQIRVSMSKALNKLARASDRNGYWSPACPTHTMIGGFSLYSPSYRVPMNSDYSIQKSILDWMGEERGSNQHIDKEPWPSNQPCGGSSTIEIQEL